MIYLFKIHYQYTLLVFICQIGYNLDMFYLAMLIVILLMLMFSGKDSGEDDHYDERRGY